MKIHDLDTPAILIDVDVMENNIRRVSAYANEFKLRLRPHTKTHKIPELGRLQLASGAAGLTVAKVSEAEVMLKAEPPDLLIAYPLVGAAKLARLMGLPAGANVTVALDSEQSARDLSAAASSAGRTIGVLAEIDVGLRRVGVQPGAPLLEFVRSIHNLPGLEFRGLAFYPGHLKSTDQNGIEGLGRVDEIVTAAVTELEAAGFPVSIVSGGSTPMLFESHRMTKLNEIRPGTYIFNDRNTWLCGACSFDDCAASILATVVSTSVPGQMIIDGGSKTFSSDRCVMPDAPGFGHFPEEPGAVLERMNEEHGFVTLTEPRRSWRVGERVRVIPNHICVAMNLHETVYGIRGEEVVTSWRVEGRGKLQ
jgi:D-serine deaminase-like pyridoxal phosphate-dependent protein